MGQQWNCSSPRLLVRNLENNDVFRKGGTVIDKKKKKQAELGMLVVVSVGFTQSMDSQCWRAGYLMTPLDPFY